MYRQGDVFLVRVVRMPAGVTRQPRNAGRVVLAYGEVTGHAHAIETAGAALFRGDDGDQYLEIRGDFSGPVGGVVVARDEYSLTVATERHGRVKFALADIYEIAGVVIPKRPWSPLKHEEHETHALPAGRYRRLPQREYGPENENIKTVED